MFAAGTRPVEAVEVCVITLYLTVFSVRPLSTRLLCRVDNGNLGSGDCVFNARRLIKTRRLRQVGKMFGTCGSYRIIIKRVLVSRSRVVGGLACTTCVGRGVHSCLASDRCSVISSMLHRAVGLALSRITELHPTVVRCVCRVAICRGFLPGEGERVLSSFFRGDTVCRDGGIIKLRDISRRIGLLLGSRSVRHRIRLLLISVGGDSGITSRCGELRRCCLGNSLSGLCSVVGSAALPNSCARKRHFLVLRRHGIG